MRKRLLKKQMMTILITIIFMLVVGVIANKLKANGFESLFTTNIYKEAYALTEYDVFLIKVFATLLEVVALGFCYINIKYNAEEEHDLILMERGELTWENL